MQETESDNNDQKFMRGELQSLKFYGMNIMGISFIAKENNMVLVS